MTVQQQATTSTGSITAQFSGSHTHSFVSDPDRQHIFKAAGQWRFSGTQLQSSDPHQNFYGLSVVLPSRLKENGETCTYNFPDEATGLVFTPHGAGIAVYIIDRGKIAVSVQNEEMIATFHFSSTFNNQTLNVEHGELRLKGVSYPRLNTSTFNGTFRNSPFPAYENFSAKETAILSHEQPLFPHTWDVVGVQPIGTFLPTHLSVSIQILKSLTDHDYEITPKNTEVFVNCNARPAYGSYTARRGTLHFDSLPGTGHAKGTLKCSFYERDDVEFQFNGTFDVRAPFYTV